MSRSPWVPAGGWDLLQSGELPGCTSSLTGGQEKAYKGAMQTDPMELHDLAGSPGHRDALGLWRDRMIRHLSERGAPLSSMEDSGCLRKRISTVPTTRGQANKTYFMAGFQNGRAMNETDRDTPGAFHVLGKPTGPLCNLGCTYCFYLEKAKLYPSAGPWSMTDEVLESFVRQYIEAQDVPAVNFAWQGGEPTLMGVDFFRKAVDSSGDMQTANRLKTPSRQTACFWTMPGASSWLRRKLRKRRTRS